MRSPSVCNRIRTAGMRYRAVPNKNTVLIADYVCLAGFGVEDDLLGRVLPGKGRFECDHTPGCGLLTRDEVFKPETHLD